MTLLDFENVEPTTFEYELQKFCSEFNRPIHEIEKSEMWTRLKNEMIENMSYRYDNMRPLSGTSGILIVDVNGNVLKQFILFRA